eukprot:UN10120
MILLRILSYYFAQQQFKFLIFYLTFQLQYNELYLQEEGNKNINNNTTKSSIFGKIDIYNNDILPLIHTNTQSLPLLASLLKDSMPNETTSSSSSSSSIKFTDMLMQDGDNNDDLDGNDNNNNNNGNNTQFFLDSTQYQLITTYLLYTYNITYIILQLFTLLPQNILYTTLFINYNTTEMNQLYAYNDLFTNQMYLQYYHLYNKNGI